MGIIARLYDFVDGTVAFSDQVDAELNQIIAAGNASTTDILAHKTSSDHDTRYYTKSQIDTTTAALNARLDTSDGNLATHKTSSDHDSRYYQKSFIDQCFLSDSNAISALQTSVANHKTSGDHDTRYYTKTLVDSMNAQLSTNTSNVASNASAALSTHAASGDHDARYYTKAQEDAAHSKVASDSAAAVTSLAGAGRTTETVKANAEAIATHITSGDHDTRYYTKVQAQTAGQAIVHWDNIIAKPAFGDDCWKKPVATEAELPATGNLDGDLRLVLDTDIVYTYDGATTSWKVAGASGSNKTSHSLLQNLLNDDHPQYLRTDGLRKLTGNLDFNGYRADNLAAPAGATPPVNPIPGQVWWNGAANQLMVNKAGGWADVSGSGALIRRKEFVATAGQTDFSVSDIGTYEVGANTMSVYKKNAAGKYEKLDPSDYTEKSTSVVALKVAAGVNDEYMCEWFENSPEVVNLVVKKDGTLQANLNADFLDGMHAADFAPAAHTVSTAVHKLSDKCYTLGGGTDNFEGYYNISRSAFGAHVEGAGSIAVNGACYTITNVNTTLHTVTLSDASGLYVGDTVNISSKVPASAPALINVQITEINGTTLTLDTTLSLILGTHKYLVKYMPNTTTGGMHAEGVGTVAITHAAHAEGLQTLASGSSSHAEGYLTTASGASSHAEGNLTTAGGAYSHAEGQSTTASATNAHAEGEITTASGQAAHAEGRGGKASGYAAHVEGNYTVATANYAHAEGTYSLAAGDSAHAEGWSTTAASAFSHSTGYGTFAGAGTTYKITAVDAANSAITLDRTTGLSAGSVITLRRDGGTVAFVNVTIGAINGLVVTIAAPVPALDALCTHAVLIGASPAYAEGKNTAAFADYSHAEGWSVIALGIASHAEGNGTTASGYAAHAEGGNTQALAYGAHSEGFRTAATGSYTHAEGYFTSAISDDAHTEGRGTKVSCELTAVNILPLRNTDLLGTSAVSFTGGHAEGFDTKTTGAVAHAEGLSTLAVGTASHAAGCGTTAQGYCQTAIGSYNIPSGFNGGLDMADYAVIVGNGTSDTARSNAATLTWGGTLDVKQGVTIGGANVLVRCTTADMTLYVRTDGNDANDGSANDAAHALKTIQAAINKIPQVVNHTVTVNVAAGTYAEDVYVRGFSGKSAININGNVSAIASAHFINSITVAGCAIHVNVTGLKALTTTAHGFTYVRSFGGGLTYCAADVSAMGVYGCMVARSTVQVDQCSFSNRGVAEIAGIGGVIYSSNNTGAGNNVGLKTEQGGIIKKLGTQPWATVLEDGTGGLIINADGTLGGAVGSSIMGQGTPIPALSGTMTVTMDGSAKSITPNGNCVFNATGGYSGQTCTFYIGTSGTTSYTLTFGTNFKTAGPLNTGSVANKYFSISFVCWVGAWVETGRTGAM